MLQRRRITSYNVCYTKLLRAFLFGDILAVGKADLLLIGGAGALILAGVGLLWRKLLAVAVHEELARVEGIDVTRVQLAFMLLLALVVSVAMKVVGALRITSYNVCYTKLLRHLPERSLDSAGRTHGDRGRSYNFV